LPRPPVPFNKDRVQAEFKTSIYFSLFLQNCKNPAVTLGAGATRLLSGHGFDIVYASRDTAKFRRAQGSLSRTFDSNTPRRYRPTGPALLHPATLGESQSRVPDPC